MKEKKTFAGLTIDGMRMINFGRGNEVTHNVFTCKRVVAIKGDELDTFRKRIIWLISGEVRKGKK